MYEVPILGLSFNILGVCKTVILAVCALLMCNHARNTTIAYKKTDLFL